MSTRTATTTSTKRTKGTTPPNEPGRTPPTGGGGSGGSGAPAGGGGGGGGGPPGGGGGPPGAGAQGEGAAAAIPFALAPARINNDVLDYTDAGTIKSYYRATEPLDPLFDVEGATLKLFLENVKQRAESFNWMPTLTITKDGQPFNLIADYGAITMQEVQQHANTYIGLHHRNAQNSFQIYNCLISSLTDSGKAKVVLESNKFTINEIPDGPLLLKVIIQLAHIDTRATVTVIRTRLSSLDTKIGQLQDNITEFNEFVKTQKASLEARGEVTHDLLVNLFKGYKAAADTRFVQYIEGKEDDYNEGKDISADSLMELAEAKYKTLVESDLWKQPTSDQKKIVALTAQIAQLKKTNKATQDRQQSNSNRNRNQNNNSNDNKPNDGSNNNNNNNRNTNKKTPWYLTPPKDNEPHEKKVGEKTYYWCPNHGKTGKWVRHKPSECKAAKETDNKDNKPKLQVNHMAVTSTASDEEDDF